MTPDYGLRFHVVVKQRIKKQYEAILNIVLKCFLSGSIFESHNAKMTIIFPT